MIVSDCALSQAGLWALVWGERPEIREREKERERERKKRDRRERRSRRRSETVTRYCQIELNQGLG